MPFRGRQREGAGDILFSINCCVADAPRPAMYRPVLCNVGNSVMGFYEVLVYVVLDQTYAFLNKFNGIFFFSFRCVWIDLLCDLDE